MEVHQTIDNIMLIILISRKDCDPFIIHFLCDTTGKIGAIVENNE